MEPIVSTAALTWARALDAEWDRLPPRADQVKAAALLRVLCDAANDELLVWLSAETIAQRSRIRSRNTIAKYLGHLEAIALIQDTGERRSAGRATGGAKCYRILVDPSPEARRDCSLHSEQTQPPEIAHSIVSKLPTAARGEFAQSGTEFAQSEHRVCSTWSEHEAGSITRSKEEETRAGAREEPPPPDALLTAEEFIADVDDETCAELAAARPDLVDHLDRFLGNFAEKRSGTGRRTRGTWLEILWDWWRREERRGRTDGQEAWERIRPQLANSARASTEDPIAAAVVADMGGFAALGRLSVYQLEHAGRDFVARYRTAARSPQQARHGPIGLARPGPDPKQHGDAMP